MDVNLPRDKETGKQKGFGFLMYEDQRSTVLAVDNLNGAKVLDRTLRVDHVKNYKQPKTKDEAGEGQEAEEQSMNAKPQMIIGESSAARSLNPISARMGIVTPVLTESPMHRRRRCVGHFCVVRAGDRSRRPNGGLSHCKEEGRESSEG